MMFVGKQAGHHQAQSCKCWRHNPDHELTGLPSVSHRTHFVVDVIYQHVRFLLKSCSELCLQWKVSSGQMRDETAELDRAAERLG